MFRTLAIIIAFVAPVPFILRLIANNYRHITTAMTPSLQSDGEDAEEADDDAENRHVAVAFLEKNNCRVLSS